MLGRQRPSAASTAAALLSRRWHARRHRATVAVGVSGGVDSAVAAMLLKEQGHEVVGVHMRNWDAAEEGSAECMEREARDARRVCAQLGIGFHEVSFVREYWHEIFEPFLDGYESGGTPNPDVACNRHIKFDHFLAHARALGADGVATGHYARLERDADGATRLLAAVDAVKDQSYFLATVQQEALRSTRFPIGHLLKSEVRAMAAAASLHPAAKRDSTGICFIGKRNFGAFLEGYLPQTAGPFVCVESGSVVGEHKGYALYTTGQRARVPGCATRWYVVDKRVPTNEVVVCAGK
jgi:tRNA (5-methylaminomethyl-2-thiouridylate)-methyltransferase